MVSDDPVVGERPRVKFAGGDDEAAVAVQRLAAAVDPGGASIDRREYPNPPKLGYFLRQCFVEIWL